MNTDGRRNGTTKPRKARRGWRVIERRIKGCGEAISSQGLRLLPSRSYGRRYAHTLWGITPLCGKFHVIGWAGAPASLSDSRRCRYRVQRNSTDHHIDGTSYFCYGYVNGAMQSVPSIELKPPQKLVLGTQLAGPISQVHALSRRRKRRTEPTIKIEEVVGSGMDPKRT